METAHEIWAGERRVYSCTGKRTRGFSHFRTHFVVVCFSFYTVKIVSSVDMSVDLCPNDEQAEAVPVVVICVRQCP